MKDVVKIELSPYNAMSVLSFLREYVNDDCRKDSKLQAICDAVDAYEKEVSKNITSKQLDDCEAENMVNQLIGKSPVRVRD